MATLEFDHNTDKSEKYLINYTTVRPMELKVLYEAISGETPVDQLTTFFGHPHEVDHDHIDTSVQFLEAIDMISRSPQDVLTRVNENVVGEELSFEVRMLLHLMQQPAPYNQLIETIRAGLTAADDVKISTEALKEAANRRDLAVQINDEKIRMWARFFEALGVINVDEDDEVYFLPMRRLVYDLFALAADQGADSDFVEAVRWIHETAMPIITETEGTVQVHRGTALVLRGLEAEGVVEFEAMGDRDRYIGLPEAEKSVGKPTEFALRSLPPDDVANAYPMELMRTGVLYG
jgi:hypothetical protein